MWSGSAVAAALTPASNPPPPPQSPIITVYSCDKSRFTILKSNSNGNSEMSTVPSAGRQAAAVPADW